MPKLTFTPDSLRRGFAIAKLVKPLTGDFVLKVSGGSLSIFSSDRRRFARAEVLAVSSDAPDGYVSEEHFLPADRQSFFESDLDSVTLTVGEKNMSVKTEGSGQSRQAVVKKRADLSRRPPMPRAHSISGARVKASLFEELIRQVSCSALVKETKTDEDMRVNQVHFYPGESCAVANARFYATVALMPGLDLDVSIVSADLPSIRSFCARLGDGDVVVGMDKSHLFISDPSNRSYVAFSRFASSRPPLQIIPDDGYSVVMSVDRDQLVKSLTWCSMAVEGTQRISLRASGDRISLLNGSQEVSHLPVQFVIGDSLSADFPVKTMGGIVKYLGDGKALLKYGNKASPDVLEIAEESADGVVRARHFVSSMKERK
ncbi:MAG: hypothetical protein BWY99_01628 [Synergistetes bacterium ADurb.BinA166]|nr:MAG: hypothetical protein BWY99_01628 [Synergistetes bacterium ADurb.BinA166]